MQTSEPNLLDRARARTDWIMGAALFVLALFVYLRTLAPTVAYLFDDSLEFQLLASRMAIAHPTGYPLYSILIKLATFLPFGDVAYRVNLVSALGAALAVTFLYLTARLVTDRFMTANSTTGAILVRAPAFIAALVCAFGETFWSQAVVAEVYTFQALLTAVILWLVLRWGASFEQGTLPERRPSLVPIAFFAGLMLTHHRMSLFILPPLAVYVLLYDRSFLRQPRQLLMLAVAFVVPLLLYLYIPLRGTVTSSLDGAYRNTLDGFFDWILGTAYTVFLTQNPFREERDLSYYFNLFVNEFTPVGLLAAFGGVAALFLRAWREWVLLSFGLVLNLAFGLTYRVTDINVFFIPAFLFAALFLAAGLAGLLWLAFYAWSNRVATAVAAVTAIVLLLLPLALYRDHYPRVDLSHKTDVSEYGRAMLSQPLPKNATIIGILGEMSLIRYFQDTQGLRPDIETIAADKEEDRSKAIEDALKRGRAVYLTRLLKGVEKNNSLSSVGPLVAVQTKPNKQTAPVPAHVLDADFGDVKLLGYSRDETGANGSGVGFDSSSALPITLFWQPIKKIPNDRFVSLKLLDANGNLAGQLDRQPVLGAYPTTAWRNGEYIADAYDLPVFVGAPPGEYTLQVTMYDPESGEVYGQQELERVAVPPQTQPVASELLGVSTLVLRTVGGMELAGYTLDTTEPFNPDATVPLALLWRAPGDGATNEIQLTVSDASGKVVQTQNASVGGKDSVSGQYVREEVGIHLPKDLAPGMYTLKLTARSGLPLSFGFDIIRLGTLEVSAP